MTYAIPEKPGKIIKKFFIDPTGMSMNKFSKEVGITQNRISNLISGRIKITAPTAIFLGDYFGISPEVFMAMQTSYDIAITRRRMAEREEKKKNGLQYPLRYYRRVL